MDSQQALTSCGVINKEEAMDKMIDCPCGYTIRTEDEQTLVSQTQERAKKMPTMELTCEQALAMANTALLASS
jgi:hypothetical protein